MKRTIAIAFAIAMLAAQAAHAQFAVDMTAGEVRKALSEMAVSDLAIEETGLTTSISLCVVDGVLFVDGETPLATSRSEYVPNYRIQRKQGGKVLIEAENGPQARTSLKEFFGILIRRSLRDECERVGIPADQRFEVISINGATSASKFLEEAK